MQKIEREMIEPIRDIAFVERSSNTVASFVLKVQLAIERLLFHHGLLLVLAGFLLGRALILEQLIPFALPFFASVYIMKKDKVVVSAIALVVGTFSHEPLSALFTICSMLLFLVFKSVTKRFQANAIKIVPIAVLVTSFLARMIVTYGLEQEITSYSMLMAGVEAGLGLILTMIFFQSVPLLALKKRKQALKNEEIISLIILFASVMTGTVGWTFYDLSFEHIVSRYLVMLFAFVGGAAIGSTVGVVTGLILSLANVSSLYQMSLLAFAGLLGGLLKDGKKYGVGLGLLIGTLLIGLYGEGTNQLFPTVVESVIAVVIFIITPKKWISKLSKHIPGTVEHSQEQQQYLRKVRDVTANRVEQFSSVFKALSSSFVSYSPLSDERVDEKDLEADLVLSNVTEKTCQMCFKKEQCWSNNFNKTYELMREVMHETETKSTKLSIRLSREWDKHCVKPDKVLDAMHHELTFFQANQKLKKQVAESRRLVADQLLGVSEVMGNFAKEIQRERENLEMQEEQILDSFRTMGIEINHADIYSLEPGNVDIEMSIPYCNGSGESEKIIAPMLSDILQETIIVKNEDCASFPNGYCYVSFGSAKAFTIDTAIANAAKGGAWISGDSYSTIELGAGKYAIAISDGMGNGERAHQESNETLHLLQKILQSGIDERVAIKSLNSILSLRTTEEIFSTLDLAMIDLQDASAKFLKIGSTPSFIKRGSQILKVEACNLPMGIIQEFDVDVVSEQLKAGDLLIMMSDGIFEGPKHVENYEMWVKRKIKEMKTDDPQEVADILLEEVIRTKSGEIDDDMTVVVAKVKRNIPKWATIPVRASKKAQ